MATPAQTRATTKYIKDHTRQYVIRCNKKTDADLIAKLDAQDNITQYIKDLIRGDIEYHWVDM